MSSQPDRHLLVDGYNVIHAEKAFAVYLPTSLDLACRLLVEQLRPIHDVVGCAVTIVFDGNRATTTIEKPGNQPGFSVVYAAEGVTADGLIEQVVRMSRQPEHVTVASRDQAIAQTARTLGASCLPPEALLQWAQQCHQRQTEYLRQHRRKLDNAPHASAWAALDLLQLRNIKRTKPRAEPKPKRTASSKPQQNEPKARPRRQLESIDDNPFSALEGLKLPRRRPSGGSKKNTKPPSSIKKRRRS
jgi:predicted RNA-binding protein with PIN domain